MITQHHQCSVCHRSDIKLYRYYGSFLHDNQIFCKRHIPADAPQTVPLIENEYGNVWGASSVPEEARKQWEQMEDGDNAEDYLYTLAMERIHALMNAAPGTQEENELDKLSRRAEKYEKAHFPLD